MKRFVCWFAAGLMTISTNLYSATPKQQQGGSTAIVLQGFHWNSSSYRGPGWYATLTSKAADLKQLGVTHVWFPPPSDSASSQGYLPRELNVFDSNYGTKSELQGALKAFSAQGITSVADVVINHRVGTTNAFNFRNPAWTTASIVNNDDCNCGTGAADSGKGFAAARDLDHTNAQVLEGIAVWMKSLKAMGFSGIRYDFAFGYRAAVQATYTDLFDPDFCVSEIWTDLDLSNVNAHRQIEMNYINGDGSSCVNSSDPTCGKGNRGTCGTFDFTTHGLLVEALSKNDYGVLREANGTGPAGAIGWWPAMEVTFVDNHDTGPAETCNSGQNLWPVPCSAVMQGYAYILTHPGIPTLFYPHIYNWGLRGPISELIGARRTAGVNSTSPISIVAATAGLYAAFIKGTGHTLAMKIGPNNWSPGGTQWKLLTSGNNYAVWMN